jgi:beta-glucanase (GH16 family)
MINLKIFFGLVPKTAEYEAKQDSLRKEYLDLQAFSASKELAEYLELEKSVQSSEFALRKKTILQQRFSDTPEYRKEMEYLKLKKKKDIQRYYKIKDSIELKDFIEFDNSFDVKHYHTLEKLVHSEEFARSRKTLGKNKFRGTPEFEKFMEFTNLNKAERFRNYFAFKNSKDYINFTLLIGSERISAFEELKHFTESDSFQKVREYMLLPGKKKLEMSEEYKQEQKYLSLKHSEKFQWYFKAKDSKKYNEIKKWQLTFSDEFDSHKLDKAKWLTRYFWGDTLLKDSYVNDAERQCYVEDKNIEITNSILKIKTLREKVKGKVWNPELGFFTRDFEYTSGIINTGEKFRQQYGLFEAKIRFNRNFPVNHGLWMISELMLPHIDVAKASGKISVGSYWGNPNVKGGVDKVSASVSRSKYGFDFFIYSLEWTRDKLVWKINGIPVCATSEGVPHMPMYINLSSSLYKDADNSVFPAELEVDWIRCYQNV